ARAVPGRADDRPRRLDAGQDARLHSRLQPTLRRRGAADEPLHGRRRGALSARHRDRPRPPDLRRGVAGAGSARASRQAHHHAALEAGGSGGPDAARDRRVRGRRAGGDRGARGAGERGRARRAACAAERRSSHRRDPAGGGDARAVPRARPRGARTRPRAPRQAGERVTAADTAGGPTPDPPSVAAELARAARAFPALLRVGVAEVVAYRAEFLVWILTTNMPLVMLALWHAVAADGPVGRFDQARFTAYYLGVLVVRLATSNWMAWQMSMEIRDGTLSAKLLRPIHPLYAHAADHISAVPMRLVVVSPIVAILFATSWGRLVRHDPRLLLILAASIAGAWLLMYFSMVLLGS